MLGVIVTINQDIDFDTALLVGSEFDVEVAALPPEEDPTEIPEVEDDPAKRLPRPPVITVMGHVDMVKLLCLTLFARLMLQQEKLAVLRSISVLIRLIIRAKRLFSLILPVTKLLQLCVRVEHR